MASLPQIESPAPAERHYAVAEIAEMWNLSPDKVRELFENEPGVLVIGELSHATREGTSHCAFLRLCSNGFILVYHPSLASARSVSLC